MGSVNVRLCVVHGKKDSRVLVYFYRYVCVCVCVCMRARVPTDHYDPRADTDSPLGEVVLKKYTRHMLRGLHYLHTQGGLPLP